MQFFDLGVWTRYVPSFPAEDPRHGLERSTEFYRNDAGQDWYSEVVFAPTPPIGVAFTLSEDGIVLTAGAGVNNIRPADVRVIVVPSFLSDEAARNEMVNYRFVNGTFIPTGLIVDRERNRRIAGGLTFEGHRFQTGPLDFDNVSAAGAAALAAQSTGAEPGDLRWMDPDADFGWIAEDNSIVPMDAPTTIRFGMAFGAKRTAYFMAARALKDSLNAGGRPDVFADASWPS